LRDDTVAEDGAEGGDEIGGDDYGVGDVDAAVQFPIVVGHLVEVDGISRFLFRDCVSAFSNFQFM